MLVSVRQTHLTLPAIDHKDVQRELVQRVEGMCFADVQVQVSLDIKNALCSRAQLPQKAGLLQLHCKHGLYLPELQRVCLTVLAGLQML